MGILSMSVRSLARRKTRTLIVITALTLALTLITILPPSINARQSLTQDVLQGLTFTSDMLKEQVTLSATEIECHYPPLATSSILKSKGSPLLEDGIGVGMLRVQTMMSVSLSAQIASLTDVVAVVPTRVDWPTESQLYRIYGVDVNNEAFQKNPYVTPKEEFLWEWHRTIANITVGRNLQPGDSGVVVISESLAKNAIIDGKAETDEEQKAAVAAWYAKEYVFNVGDSFEVLGRKFTVVGIEQDGIYAGIDSSVTMCLEDLQSITGNTGQISSLKVFVNDADNVNSVMVRIKNIDSDLMVSSGFSQRNTVGSLQDQVDALILVAQTNLSQVQRVGLAELGVGVVAAAAVILFMMLYSVRERTKEIGTLKAMGASTRRVLGQFMLEGILLCIIAVVIAIAISTFVLPQLSSLILPAPVHEGVSMGWDTNGAVMLNNVTFGSMDLFMSGKRFGAFDPQTSFVPVESYYLSVGWVVLNFGLAVGLGALGSLYPALKAARVKPAEAMRYE